MSERPRRDEVDRLLRRRRRRRIVWSLILAPVAVWAAGMVWVYATGAAHRVPPHIRNSGDVTAIARALRSGSTPRLERAAEIAPRDPFVLPEGVAIDSTIELPPVPETLEEAATAWVGVLNTFNPHLFLHHHVDAYGNLYVVPGPWYYELEADDYPYVIDLYAAYWQYYLKDGAGEFPNVTAGGLQLKPGVIMFDCQGEVARRMDGVVRVTRLPDPSCVALNPDVQ